MQRIDICLPILIPEMLYRLGVFILLRYRRLRYGYPFRRIPLTRGFCAIVDPEDYHWLSRYKWHVNKFNHTFYAVRNLGRTANRRAIKMHRQITKAPDWLFVDHINHNGRDNRKANLRLATPAQNSWNTRKVKAIECASRFKGVYWHKHDKKWAASIQVNKVRKTIGYFDNEVEAACAYDNAARKYHGEFAVVNFGRKE